MSNLSEKEITEILNELKTVRPEKLTGEAKRLFEAIMKIADERDELLKERQADKEHIKKLEGQVKMLDEAYVGVIKESKKYFDIVQNSTPNKIIKEKISVLRGKTVCDYNNWKYNKSVHIAELNMIDKLEKELLKDGGE